MTDPKAKSRRHKYISLIVVVCSVFLSMGLLYRVHNLEHFAIVDALNSFSASGDCELQIELERSLLYLGGARLYEVRLAKGAESQSTKVSVHFTPTRIMNNGNSFYHYEWSEARDEDGGVEWSYVDVEIDWNGHVQWLEVGECDDGPADREYLDYEHKTCSGGTSAVSCT